eukprot:TCALIF_09135-PA protein Name:"Protein of unknown function" AED:0.07 eAED:0.07 QI:403/1/0.66/1/0.5/0.66/3/0/184
MTMLDRPRSFSLHSGLSIPNFNYSRHSSTHSTPNSANFNGTTFKPRDSGHRRLLRDMSSDFPRNLNHSLPPLSGKREEAKTKPPKLDNFIDVSIETKAVSPKIRSLSGNPRNLARSSVGSSLSSSSVLFPNMAKRLSIDMDDIEDNGAPAPPIPSLSSNDQSDDFQSIDIHPNSWHRPKKNSFG